jgi:MEMO1 family protein
MSEMRLHRGEQADVCLRGQERRKIRFLVIGGRLRKLRVETLRQLSLNDNHRDITIMDRNSKALRLFLFVVLVLLSPACLSGEEASGPAHARPPAVAGSFYPDDPSDLRAMITDFLSKAPAVTVPGRPLAVIAPHAGYIYSGPTAAAGFKAITGNSYDTVIVIGPSHHYSFDGSAVYADGPYRTPLGDVPLDTELIDSITKKGERITKNGLPHLPEHSVEVEVPFLQVVLGDFKIVPIVMGDQTLASCEDLAHAIAASVGGKKVLIVASSDLSHYYSRTKARELDGVLRKFLEKNDPNGLYEALVTRKTEACGGGPIVTALLAAKELGSTGVVVAKYDDSGTETGTTDAVVGYISAVVYGRGGVPAGEGGGTLSGAEKTELLKLARRTIECGLSGESFPDYTGKSSNLIKNGAAFVTLKEHGELRGCVGFTEPVYPLWEAVERAAALAAFRDTRFFPVTKAELKDISIEVSVLSDLVRIKSADDIVIGTHGVVIRKGDRSGLFLPQVPVEQGWNREQYLQYLCEEKAGLLPDDWKEKDAELYVFTTDIFSEE